MTSTNWRETKDLVVEAYFWALRWVLPHLLDLYTAYNSTITRSQVRFRALITAPEVIQASEEMMFMRTASLSKTTFLSARPFLEVTNRLSCPDLLSKPGLKHLRARIIACWLQRKDYLQRCKRPTLRLKTWIAIRTIRVKTWVNLLHFKCRNQGLWMKKCLEIIITVETISLWVLWSMRNRCRNQVWKKETCMTQHREKRGHFSKLHLKITNL